MTAMFPDSGVPPADARNSLPDPNSFNCNELWYSTSRCQPRFDPAAANAVLAELVNLVNRATPYDCSRLDQVERAVRYLIQQGLPHSGIAYGGPNSYTLTLDPPPSAYTNHLTLVIVPLVNNQGPSTLSANGIGSAYILRNDGQHLVAGDLRAERPQIVSYWNGYFYFIGLAQSQVPIVLRADVDAWVRTDGSDITGDGTANTPQKAFRTIQHAFNAVADRYTVSYTYALNIRLGIPGTYAAASMSSTNLIRLWGDPANPDVYRIAGDPNAPYNQGYCLFFHRTSAELRGVTLQMDHGPPNAFICLRAITNSAIQLHSCRFVCMINNTAATFMWGHNSSLVFATRLDVVGGVGNMAGVIALQNGGKFFPYGAPATGTMSVDNINLDAFVTCYDLAVANFGGGGLHMVSTNVNGYRHRARTNSVVDAGGNVLPGSMAGLIDTGAQYIP